MGGGGHMIPSLRLFEAFVSRCWLHVWLRMSLLTGIAFGVIAIGLGWFIGWLATTLTMDVFYANVVDWLESFRPPHEFLSSSPAYHAPPP
jgi:hypothetical protein